MVREIVTRAWCDLHMMQDERVEMSETHEVTLDGEAFTLDLCAEHVADFQSFAELVRTGSAKTKTKTETPRAAAAASDFRADGSLRAKSSRHARICLVCGDSRTAPQAFRNHLGDAHGTDVGGVYGTTCPVCGKEHGSVQALGIHGSKTHADIGALDVATLFQYARENGDPHGVVRERLEKTRHMNGALLPL